MATDLTRIGAKARQEPTLVFTTLYHHITDVDNLRACYDHLPARKASGVDGVTKAEYGEHLEDHLRDLSARLKRQAYRPAPKRRTLRAEGRGRRRAGRWASASSKTRSSRRRPERTLEPIYEAVFEDSSYGYRPGRSPHQCLDALGRTLQQERSRPRGRGRHPGLLRYGQSRVAGEVSAAPSRRRAGDSDSSSAC